MKSIDVSSLALDVSYGRIYQRAEPHVIDSSLRIWRASGAVTRDLRMTAPIRVDLLFRHPRPSPP